MSRRKDTRSRRGHGQAKDREESSGECHQKRDGPEEPEFTDEELDRMVAQLKNKNSRTRWDHGRNREENVRQDQRMHFHFVRLDVEEGIFHGHPQGGCKGVHLQSPGRKHSK